VGVAGSVSSLARKGCPDEGGAYLFLAEDPNNLKTYTPREVMTKYDSFKEKVLANPEVAKEYEAHKAEFEIARALIKARLAANMSQTEVARKMHTSQSQVARLESGTHFPSIQTIHRYAQAINHKISFEIKP